MLTTAQVANLFQISICTVRRYIKKGLIPSIMTPGGHYRIQGIAVHDLMVKNAPKTTLDARKDIRSRAKALLTIHNMNDKGDSMNQVSKSSKFPESRRSG